MGALLKFVLKENFLKITKILRYREVSSKSIAKNQIKGTISPPPLQLLMRASLGRNDVSLETPIFHWRPASGVSIETLGVINVNLGVSNENIVTLMKILVYNKKLGVSNENIESIVNIWSPTRTCGSLTRGPRVFPIVLQ